MAFSLLTQQIPSHVTLSDPPWDQTLSLLWVGSGFETKVRRVQLFTSCHSRVQHTSSTRALAICGPTDVGEKKNFVPRVTLGTILNQQNLELL